MASETRTTINPNDPYRGMRAASTLPQDAKDFLAEVLPPERGPSGKFVRGRLRTGPESPASGCNNHGNYNFTKLVREYIERCGNNVSMVVAELFEDLMVASDNGDTNASKFLVERLCGKQSEQVDMTVTHSKLSEVERITRLTTLLDEAARRRREGKTDVRRN